MDPIPVGGFPAENGATTPQFFHTAGPNRIHSTPSNVSGSGDDIPRQYNAFINFEDPNGYKISAPQRAAVEDWYRQFEDVLYDNDIWQDPDIGYRRHLDTTDFIDYFQLLTLAKQGDGLLLSMFPWVSSGERKLRMGPMWDFNNGAYGGSATSTLYFRPDRLWFDRLFDDPTFQREYEDRWFELREGPLSNENMAAIIDAQVTEITTALADQQSGLSASSWNSRVATMKSWLQTRANWIDSNFLPPPDFSSNGGVISPGFQLTITNTTDESGTIYYSTDERDPMETLTAFGSQIIPLVSMEISARVRTDSGNWSAIRRATFVVGTPASSDNLTISEINYHPTDSYPNTEFIELVNTSPTEVIDLTEVAFTAGLNFTFPVNTLLNPGERIVVVENIAAFTELHGDAPRIAGEFSNLTNLANSGEQLILSAADGSVIADFTYNDKDPWPEFADGEGCTLTLIQAETNPDLSQAAGWRCSTARHGSPGLDDSLIFTGEPDDLPSFILGSTLPKATLPNIFEFRVMLGADEFIVIPQRSDDLITWEAIPMPTQADSFNDDGTATYRLPIEGLDSRTFLRLVITPR